MEKKIKKIMIAIVIIIILILVLIRINDSLENKISVEDGISLRYEDIEVKKIEDISSIISIEKILNNDSKLKQEESRYKIKEIYEKYNSIRTESKYYIFLEELNMDYTFKNEIYIEMQKDFLNKTYKIIKIDKNNISKQKYLNIIEKEEEVAEKENQDIENVRYEKIIPNGENSYSDLEVDEKGIAEYYLKDLQDIINKNPDMAYKLLDEEYSNKKFKNEEHFKKYIKENQRRFKENVVKEYSFIKKDDYTQLMILDNENNYYIFKIKDFMEYKVILDQYTVENEDLNKIYDNKNDVKQGGINIQKIIASIKDGDYGYIYSKMTEGFKKNKYSNKDKFENLMKKIFSGKEFQTEIVNFNDEGNIYIYDIEFRNEKERLIMQILMRLKEKQDFEISFNIKEKK